MINQLWLWKAPLAADRSLYRSEAELELVQSLLVDPLEARREVTLPSA